MSGISLQPKAQRRHKRQPLLSTCAIASAMVATGHVPVQAQSFLGSVTSATNATVVNNVANRTVVSVTAPTAIVNWTPNDTAAGAGAITFQNSGTTAVFQSSGGDYTVLNRIVPTGAAADRSVLLNGNINSYIGLESGNQRGGSVWFYSPNGLIIGSQANINVGSLLLTTRDVADLDFLDNNGTYTFGAADNSRSRVTISGADADGPGANIIASNSSPTGDSYVAIVAPRITQAGNVRVDGSAAYVAAEQATVTIPGDLFDIQIASGSSVDTGTPGDNQVLTHSGTTLFEATANNPVAYMVSVPKNLAVTMLVGGEIGYDANAVSVEGGTIVLSAGYTRDGDSGAFVSAGAAGIGADVTLTGTFRAAGTTVYGRTNALATGDLVTTGSLTVHGGASATLRTAAGTTIDIGGNLNIVSLNTDNSDALLRGTALIEALGGAIDVAGDINVDATQRNPGASSGGFARVNVSNGSLIGESLTINADAFGGGVTSTGETGGTGTGGTASLSLTSALTAPGSITMRSSSIQVRARGTGGGVDSEAADAGINGGSGFGGNATITMSGAGGTLAANTISVDASGIGISGTETGDGSTPGGNGGTGSGGTATFDAAGGTITAASVTVSAAGIGGDGGDEFGYGSSGAVAGNAGAAFGGAARLSTGTIYTVETTTVDASAAAGDAGSTIFSGGQDGNGASATARTDNGAELNFLAGAIVSSGSSAVPTVTVNASATATGGQTAGSAVGGRAVLTSAANAPITLASAAVNSRAIAGDAVATGANGGSATSGNASVGVTGGALTITALTLGVDASGGNSSTATGGNGTAGTAALRADGGTLALGNAIAIAATGTGGSGPVRGGNGTGGGATIDISNAGTLTFPTSGISLSANGIGGSTAFGATPGIGGSGTGGTVSVNVSAATLTLAGDLTLSATGSGTDTQNIGGAATGGTISVTTANNGSISLARLDATATAEGGDGRTGGAATGGDITVTLASGGDITTSSDVSLRVTGTGGVGNWDANGGAGTGGDILIGTLAEATNSVLTIGQGLNLSAEGIGGASRQNGSFSNNTGTGGDGGAGVGGSVRVQGLAGTLAITGLSDIRSGGQGGLTRNGGTGGAATGGSGTIEIAGGSATFSDIDLLNTAVGGAFEVGYGVPGASGGVATGGVAQFIVSGGTFTAGSLNLANTAFGGNGSNGSGAIAGGNGGNATGGTADIQLTGGTTRLANLSLSAQATGGDGGNGSSGSAGGGAGSATGGSVTVSIDGPDADVSFENLSFNGEVQGGRGGNGGSGTNGGAGGAGGNANGGSIALTVARGALSAGTDDGGVTVTLSATGGRGGDSGDGSANGPSAVAGGDGGNALAGDATFATTGGTLALGDVFVAGRANGGDGGNGGVGAGTPAVPDDPSTPGNEAQPAVPFFADNGDGGDGIAGTIRFSATDEFGTPFLTAGNVTVQGEGFGGFGTIFGDSSVGLVEIRQESFNAEAAMRFASLDVSTFGGTLSGNDGIVIASNGGELSVAGNASFSTSGNVFFEMGGNGRLDVDGELLASGFFVSGSHSRGPDDLGDTINAGSVRIFGDYVTLASGTVVRADSIDIDAGVDADVAALYARAGIRVFAGQTLRINTAIADGEVDSGGTDLAEAGGGRVTLTAGQPQFVPSFVPAASEDALSRNDIEVTGTVSGTNSVTLNAGGDIRVLSGATIESDNLVALTAGDDIVVDSGATLRAALNPLADPADTGALDIDTAAGLVLAAGPTRQNLAYVPDSTDVAAIVINGTISAGDRPVFLAAQAIQANAQPISGRTLVVEIDGAPALGSTPNNDGGLLSAGCERGNVCLGAINATNLVAIGGLTGTAALPNAINLQGGLSSNRLSLRARGDVVLGAVGSSLAYTGTRQLTIQSTTGAVRLLGATTLTGGTNPGDQLRILAATGLEGTGASIVAGGTAQFYLGSGGLSLANLTVASRIDTLNAAGGIIAFDSLQATGPVAISGITRVTNGQINVFSDAGISLGDVASNGDIALSAGGDIALGTAVAGGDINLDAGGAVTGTSWTAGDDILVDAQSISVTSAIITAQGEDDGEFGYGSGSGYGEDGRNIVLNAFGAITVGTASAVDDIAITSTTGSVNAATLEAGDDVTIFADAITLGSVSTFGTSSNESGYGADGSNIRLTALADPAFEGNAITITGTADAENAIDIVAGGAATIATAIAGDDLTVSSALLNAGQLTAGGDISVATSSIITIASLNAGGDAELRSESGPVEVTTDIQAGGQIFASGAAVTLNAIGSLDLAEVTATDGDIDLTAGGSVILRQVSAAADLLVDAGTTIDARTVSTVGGGLRMVAGGDIVGQDITATRSLMALSRTGGVTFGDVESVGGFVNIGAQTNIDIGNVRAAGSIFLTGMGAITAGDLTAGTGPLIEGETNNGGTDPATPGIAPGFDDLSLVRCDDSCTLSSILPFALNYFGQVYDTTFVSNNGYITFGQGQATFTPTGLGSGYNGLPIIAAFFADVDTRNPQSALTTYGAGTFAGRAAFGVTYENVGYFPSAADKLNSFQIVLTNRADTGAGNFDIYYNYTNITWETGGASGGTNGFGGTSAAVGYNAGTGNAAGTFFELPGSRVPGTFLNTGPAPLITTTNNGNPGQLLFQVRNGQVSQSVVERPSIHVTNSASTAENRDINLGNLSAEAVEVRGAGSVNVANVDVGDRGSELPANGQPYATVLDAGGSLQVNRITSTGLVALGADAGTVLAGPIDTGSSVVVLANGDVQLSTVSTGTGATDGLFVYGRDVIGQGAFASFDFASLLNSPAFNAASLVNTLGSATLDAAGVVRLTGDVRGGNIGIASRDIVLDGGEGRLQIGIDTNTISLTGGRGRMMQVGGNGVEDVWSLSNNEFGQLSAHRILFSAGQVEDGYAMTVGRLDVIGAAGADSATRRRNLTGSELIFNSAGSLLVNDAVTLTAAGADDSVAFNAAALLFVDTATGSVSLSNATGGLGGKLILDGGTVFVGTQAALAFVQDPAKTTDERDERLADNDGENRPQGFLQADAIEFGGSSGIYVQNSGVDRTPSGDRAGFTAGFRGVTLVTRGQQPTEIIINGRQSSSDGGFVTGRDLIPLITLRGQGTAQLASFNPRSTVNGCLITGFGCRFDLPDNIGTPQQDIINELISPDDDFDGETSLVQALNTPVIQFSDVTGINVAPIIEEPVTGAGNEDLWMGANSDGLVDVDQQVTGTRNENQDGDVNQQVTGTRNDAQDGDVNQQVTGTRNENQDGDVSQQVTGTRNENRDGDVNQPVTGTRNDTQDEATGTGR